jgi:modification methylase
MITNPKDVLAQADSIAYLKNAPRECAELVFADPPYFMQLEEDLHRPDGSTVDAVTDEWDKFKSFADYDQFTRDWLMSARGALKPNGALWVIGSYHNIHRVGAIMQDQGWWILNEITWTKSNPTPQMKGTRFCSAHETLLWAVPSKKARYTFHYKEMKAANEDKQMRSDWYFNICQGKERILDADGKKAHSTQKPEALLRRIILATTNPGDTILDPFVGSGTSAAVAKKLGRHYIGIDLDPKNIAISEQRLAGIEFGEELHGDMPPLAGANKPKIAFVSLVEQGFLKPGESIALRKGKDTYLATVYADGTVGYVGDKHETKAPAPIRGSIHQVGKAILGLPSCNGWTTWEYYDFDLKELKFIDNLRSVSAKCAEEGENNG